MEAYTDMRLQVMTGTEWHTCTHTLTLTSVRGRRGTSACTDTYPSPEAPEAVHFGLGGHEVVESVGQGLLGLFGGLGSGAGVRGHSRR